MAVVPQRPVVEPEPLHPRNANAVRKPSESLLNLSLFCSSGNRRELPLCGDVVAAAGGCYAIDAEMVTVRVRGRDTRAMVSVGIVNDRLETVLYSRVAVPEGCEVIDGAFARVQGGLWASWGEGIPASCVSDLLVRHTLIGGLIIGWELHGDLEVVGFEKAAALAKEGEREGLPLDVTSLLDNRDDSVAASAASNSSMVQTTTATTAKAKINQSQPEPQRHQTRNGEPKKTNEYLNATTGHLIGGSGGGGGGCDNSGAASPISRSSTQQTSQDNGGEAEEHNNAAATSNNSSSSSSGSCCGTAASNSNTPMLDKMSRNSDDRTGNEQLGKAPCDVARTTTSDSEAERREPNCRSLQHNGEDEKECEAERVCVAHERGGGVSAGANGGVAGAGIEGGLERIEEKNAAEGLMEGEPTMTVVDVTDLFRTTKGLKCMLSEAYSCVFGRTEQGAHNAATDARMTMELYNVWRRVGEPEGPIGIPLCFFVVNFHSFKNPKSRQEILWNVLRPDRGGRATVSEKDSGMNTYKLFFRNERERDAYLTLLQARMAAEGLKWGETKEAVPGRKGAKDGYQLSCGKFKMHVLEHDR